MSRDQLRDRIRATANPKPVPIKNVPGWEGVYVKPITVGEIDSASSEADPKLATARGVARVLCDEAGTLLFDLNEPSDLALIQGLPSDYLNRINDALQELSPTAADALAELGNGSPRETASS